ncbi:MAG TPA: hypothetical protein DFR83_05075, partial [Deltaproteobacteria bacterium]|nr:hypothetical protein [Deltaproteobacteria bacterium]
MLFTVRGKGYRFVPPNIRDARARTRGLEPLVAVKLASSLVRSRGLIQVLGGSAPARSGLVRDVIDELGGPPPGGVLWVSGRFSTPDELAIATATAGRPGLPVNLSLVEQLQARASTIVVIDAIAKPSDDIANQIRQWRIALPHLNWIVMTTHPMALPHNGIHDLGPTANAHDAARYIRTLSLDARLILSQLLASPGPVDLALVDHQADATVLEEVDRSGLVRISGRDAGRRATLITGATATVAASLSTSDQRHGQTKARRLVETLVPDFRIDRPWDLLTPSQEVAVQAARHHPLINGAIDDAIVHRRSRDLHVATSAISLMCGCMPRALTGDWLRTRGRRLLEGPHLPGHAAMVHLALAWLETVPFEPLFIGMPSHQRPERPRSMAAHHLETARRHLQQAQALAEEHELEHLQHAMLILRACWAVEQGRPDEARPLAHEARLTHQMSGQATGQALASLLLAELCTRRGEAHAGDRWLSEAIPLLETHHRPNLAAQVRVALGRMALAKEDTTQAALHLDAALVYGRSQTDRTLVALAADLMSEVEHRAGRTS